MSHQRTFSLSLSQECWCWAASVTAAAALGPHKKQERQEEANVANRATFQARICQHPRTHSKKSGSGRENRNVETLQKIRIFFLPTANGVTVGTSWTEMCRAPKQRLQFGCYTQSYLSTSAVLTSNSKRTKDALGLQSNPSTSTASIFASQPNARQILSPITIPTPPPKSRGVVGHGELKL